MNRKIILGIVLSALSLSTQAQTAYEKAMTSKIEGIEIPKKTDEYTALANDFVRIGDKEKTQWQPYYYAAFSLIQKGRTEMQKDTGKLDQIAEEAEKMIEKAEAISPNNAELFLLGKMNYGMKMMVDPATRWMTDGQSAAKALAEAKKLDPENPRITILEAEDAYFTPEQFGGSKSRAKELFSKALEQFKVYKLKNALDPNWGQGEAQYFLKQMEQK